MSSDARLLVLWELVGINVILQSWIGWFFWEFPQWRVDELWANTWPGCECWERMFFRMEGPGSSSGLLWRILTWKRHWQWSERIRKHLHKGFWWSMREWDCLRGRWLSHSGFCKQVRELRVGRLGPVNVLLSFCVSSHWTCVWSVGLDDQLVDYAMLICLQTCSVSVGCFREGEGDVVVIDFFWCNEMFVSLSQLWVAPPSSRSKE